MFCIYLCCISLILPSLVLHKYCNFILHSLLSYTTWLHTFPLPSIAFNSAESWPKTSCIFDTTFSCTALSGTALFSPGWHSYPTLPYQGGAHGLPPWPWGWGGWVQEPGDEYLQCRFDDRSRLDGTLWARNQCSTGGHHMAGNRKRWVPILFLWILKSSLVGCENRFTLVLTSSPPFDLYLVCWWSGCIDICFFPRGHL